MVAAGRWLGVAAALMAGCAPRHAPDTTPQGATSPVVIEPARPAPVPLPDFSPRSTLAADRLRDVWVDSVMRTLPMRDRIAQLVWPWILGDFVAEDSDEWARISRQVRDDHVGGYIVSLGSPLDIAAKLNALQRMSKTPLLVSADLETGVGFRARGGFFVPNGIDLGGATTFPLQMAFGAARDSAAAYELGRVTALEGRALGIHIAYGPVLDVNNNPANPVIGARAFSEDPHLTAMLGAAVVRGLQDNGMLATGKHFPGHGDTETNSHLALASVTASRARLDSVELIPFRAAVRAGVGGMMTFHGFLPALDSAEVPATLSPTIMTELLRKELGFDGLLVTDAMDMRGVVDKFGAAEAAKGAIAAGADLLLMPSDIKGTIDAVELGLRERRYTEDRINQSVRRVLALKHQFGLNRERVVPLERVRQVVGRQEHQQSANRIAERGFVLARDTDRLIPLQQNGRPPRLLSVTYARRAELSAGGTFNAALRAAGADVRTAFVSADDQAPSYDRLLADVGRSDVVVVGSYVNISSTTATADSPVAFTQFVNALIDRGARVVLVSFGTPYLLMHVPRAGTYAIAWGGSSASQRAAARALLGVTEISATLPISIPPMLKIGDGQRRSAAAGGR